MTGVRTFWPTPDPARGLSAVRFHMYSVPYLSRTALHSCSKRPISSAHVLPVMRLPPAPILHCPVRLRLSFSSPGLLSTSHPHHRTLITSSSPAPTINIRTIPAPHSGSIRILSLNRPSARNAISVQLLTELSHQIKSLHAEGEAGPTRALIIASEIDTAFCAGADLKERLKMTQDE